MKKSYLLLVITFLCVLLILLPYVLNFREGIIDSKSQAWGDFGGYIGGTLGSFFTLISVILLYITLQKQLDFSKNQEIDNIVLKFENNFFKLLNIQRDIYKTTGGNKSFRMLKNNLNHYINFDKELVNFSSENIRNSTQAEKIKLQLQISKCYMLFYNEYVNYLSHYIRHFYSIVEYIEHSSIDNKRIYYDFLSAQLNDDELFVIFYNSIYHNSDNLNSIFDQNRLFSGMTLSENYMINHGITFFPDTFSKIIVQESSMKDIFPS